MAPASFTRTDGAGAAAATTVSAAFQNCMSLGLKFDGRTSRPEYWYYTGPLLVVWLVLYPALASVLGDNPLVVIALVILSFPNIAASVRRLHDIDRTGLWVLIGFVPLGVIVLIYFLALAGEPHANRFGPPPA